MRLACCSGISDCLESDDRGTSSPRRRQTPKCWLRVPLASAAFRIGRAIASQADRFAQPARYRGHQVAMQIVLFHEQHLAAARGSGSERREEVLAVAQER